MSIETTALHIKPDPDADYISNSTEDCQLNLENIKTEAQDFEKNQSSTDYNIKQESIANDFEHVSSNEYDENSSLDIKVESIEDFESNSYNRYNDSSLEDIKQELIDILNTTETQCLHTSSIISNVNIIDDNYTSNYIKFKKIKRHKWTRKHWFRGYFRPAYRIRFSDRIFCVSSTPQRRILLNKLYEQYQEGPEWSNYIRQISGLCFVVNNENCTIPSSSNSLNARLDDVDGDEPMTENISLSGLEDSNIIVPKCERPTEIKKSINNTNTEIKDDIFNYSITIQNDFTNKEVDEKCLENFSNKNNGQISEDNNEDYMSEDNNEKNISGDRYEDQMNEDDDEANDLPDLSIVVRNNVSDTTKRLVNLEKNQINDSFVNNVCVVINNDQPNDTNKLSDITVIVENTPINIEKKEWLGDISRHEYLSAFQRICHKHFISKNCNRTNCQLLHIIPKDFQNILQNFDCCTLMKAYDWVKETLLFQHILPFFINVFVNLKKSTELSDTINDIFKPNCTNKIESIKLVLKGLQALEYTFSEAVDFIILRHGVANIEMCDSLLTIIIETHNLKENWFLIKKLVTFRTIRLPDALIIKMISISVGAAKPDVELCKNINQFVVNKNLANIEIIPNLFLKSFNKIVQMSNK